jgi:acetyl-CoA carboxylase carboxyl transferase subunit alpha
MAMTTFEFEKPIADLEAKLAQLRQSEAQGEDVGGEIRALEAELQQTRETVYRNLTPHQRVLIARHFDRPHSLDYIRALFERFVEIHGDRQFRDDPAVVCGLGFFQGHPVAVIGQQKGKDVKENVARNFGMMHPEGYRKALRTMKLADKFRRPIVVLVDTPGAYPGIGAEERGQAEAIARNIMEMFTLGVPIVVIILGEGASGGALGIGVGDRVLMLENAWYSVISPEGCASILWRDAKMAPVAAENLKLTAPDLMELGVIDGIIPEPLGGAHRDPRVAIENVRLALEQTLDELAGVGPDTLRRQRHAKYRAMGKFIETAQEQLAAAEAAPPQRSARNHSNADGRGKK